MQEDIDLGLIDLAEFGRHLHSPCGDVGFRASARPPQPLLNLRLLTPAVLLVAAVAVGLGVLPARSGRAPRSRRAARGPSGSDRGGRRRGAVRLRAVRQANLRVRGERDRSSQRYKTEKGGWSHFFLHTADRAFSDPDANTRRCCGSTTC